MTISVKAKTTGQRADDQWLEATPGELFKFRVSSLDTKGIYTMFEVVAESRNGVPMHTHRNEDEHFVVLEGTLRLANDDEPAGTAITVKRGVPHAWANMTDAPVRFPIIFSPGRIEDMFRQNIAATDDPVAAAANAERYGTVLVGPPIADGLYTFANPRP